MCLKTVQAAEDEWVNTEFSHLNLKLGSILDSSIVLPIFYTFSLLSVPWLYPPLLPDGPALLQDFEISFLDLAVMYHLDFMPPSPQRQLQPRWSFWTTFLIRLLLCLKPKCGGHTFCLPMSGTAAWQWFPLREAPNLSHCPQHLLQGLAC